MLIRDGDGLVVFSADEMAHHGGRFRNYWGSYWTCQKCQVSWGSHVARCARCLAEKTEDVAQSPVGADGWLDQQKLTDIVEAEGAFTMRGFGAVYNALNAIADEQEKIGADGWLDQQKLKEKMPDGYTARRVGQQDKTFAAEGTFITKPTAEEKLDAIRKIFEQFSWEYGSDPYVYADIKVELWDELIDLLIVPDVDL